MLQSAPDASKVLLMTNEKVYAIILTGNDAAMIDLNDWAVNTVREFCRERGYNPAAVVAEETARINAADMNLDTYLRVSRAGSRVRLTRKARRALWVASFTRDCLMCDAEDGEE